MPYIKSTDDRRQKLINGDVARNAGELNFQIFVYVRKQITNMQPVRKDDILKFVIRYLDNGRNYQRYNDITGVLVCCYKELKRRFNIEVKVLEEVLEMFDEEIVNYEKKKIYENGDV